MSKIKHTAFQGLLYEEFVVNGKYSVVDTARKMANMSHSTLYHYIEGQNIFPVDLLALLYNVTKNPAFLNFILNDTDMMLCPRQKPDGEKSLLEEALDVAGANGDLVANIQRALKDGTVKPSERKELIRLVDQNHKELEDLKKRLVK